MCTKNYSDQMFTIIPVTISVMGVSSYRVHEARTLRPWPKEPIYIWVEWKALFKNTTCWLYSGARSHDPSVLRIMPMHWNSCSIIHNYVLRFFTQVCSHRITSQRTLTDTASPHSYKSLFVHSKSLVQ